jgi:hypothetical protein
VQSDADPVLWILFGDGGTVLAMFHVDDGLLAARTAAGADGSASRSRFTWIPKISSGALALAESFGARGARKAVPMSPELFAELRSVQDGDDMAVQLDFQRGIGSLLHLAHLGNAHAQTLRRPWGHWRPSVLHSLWRTWRQCWKWCGTWAARWVEG